MEDNQQLITPTVDLLAPSNRFASSSHLYGRLHRWQLLLRRYWWLIGLILAVVLIPVYLYTAYTLPTYESKARLWLAGKLDIAEGRLYTEELVDYLATQAELLRSATIQQRALARLLAQNPKALAGISHRQQSLPLVREIKGVLTGLVGPGKAGTNAPPAFPFAVKVSESSKSSTLLVRAIGNDPASTRAFLNCLLDEYFDFKKQNRTKMSDATLASVRSEVHQLSTELKEQQDKLHAFQTTNNVVFLQEQGSSAASYLAQLNRQISVLRTQLRLLERLDPEQWLDVETRGAAKDPAEPKDAAAAQMLANLTGPQADLFNASRQMQLLKAKRDGLSKFLRPQHPKILKLDEDIATWAQIVQISRQEALKQLATRQQALQLEITNLTAAFAEWDRKAIESSRKIADYNNMTMDMQRLQNAYDHVFNLMQTVETGKAVDQENVGVLQSATLPWKVPRMLINLGCALLIALALSFCCLYGLGMFDDRFASLSELSDYLSEDVLGQVPSIWLRHPKDPLGVKFLERQQFEFLEAFRNIRSSLLYMNKGAQRPKTILITSSVPREGKSTVALYLAATLAMGHSRVLLIDGDMRRSSLHRYFAAPPGPGLAEILSQEVTVAGTIIPSTILGLALLPAGAAKRNPGELVLSGEWKRLIDEVSPAYDYILIDSPPLLATDDAASLAPQVDGVLVVVRGSFTSARAARRALNELRRRHAKILGLIFNRAVSSAYEHHSYQRYRNSYGWKPDQSPQPQYLPADATANYSGS